MALKDDLPGVSLPPSPGSFNSQVAVPETRPPSVGPPIETLTSTVPGARRAEPSDLDVHGGPLVRRDGSVVELTRYQQSGKVEVEGDTVTQQLGRGRTAEYSLSQLAAHSSDATYFADKMRYAAAHGDSVRIDVHDGKTTLTDARLEHSLPRDLPDREAILRAAVKHDFDPVLLGAIGMQETRLGKDTLPLYDPKTQRGDFESDQVGGHGYGHFQLDDQTRAGQTPRSQSLLDHVAHHPNFAADYAVSGPGMLQELIRQNGSVKDGVQAYNGADSAFGYYNRVMGFYNDIQRDAARDFPSQQLGR